MNVLLTGGAGFIGSHVAEQLLDAGHRVTIVDDLSTGKLANVPAGATFIELDIRSDEAARLVRLGGFDALLHFAAQPHVGFSVREPILDASINVTGFVNLLSAIPGGTIQKVVLASSGGVIYGPVASPPITEDCPAEPTSPYGVAKLAAEHYLRVLGAAAGIKSIALRFANVYGPRQDPGGEGRVLAIFLEQGAAGLPFTILGDGNQTRDFVHVTDAARATTLALETSLNTAEPTATAVLNIGTGRETSVRELAELVARALGVESRLEKRPFRAGDLLRNALDSSRADALLGWRPRITLEEGVKSLAKKTRLSGAR